MLTLRSYQEAAKAAVYQHLRTRVDHPCVVIPTAGGKTPIMASICKDAVGQWKGRVLILAHVKELLEQSADKLRVVCPEVDFGIYSAGLRRRDTQHPVIIAGIQSVYQRACELDAFNLVLVDEAHLISADGDGMYRQFLADAKVINPELRIIGFTATPFRLKQGPICTPDGILNHICYEVGVRELIRDGYLCPLISKAGTVTADTSSLHVRGGEFVADEVAHVMDQDDLVRSACHEVVGHMADRHACLIFASSIQHGEHIVETLARHHQVTCGFITGETPAKERATTLVAFQSGQLRYLCNVNVLTTGFDAPHIDCVAMVRPTMSPGLYYQMVGRGFRLHPSKENCLVLDFGGNVLRHGPVDDLRVTPSANGKGPAPVKQCPECQALVATGYARCPECGHEFPPPQRTQHEATASEAGILSGQVTTTKYRVEDVTYQLHIKRAAGADAPRTLRVDYWLNLRERKSEFICLEHDGYARQKAIVWWHKRSPDPVPDNVERALGIIEAGGLATTEAIVVRHVSGEKYDRIIQHELGPMPEAVYTECQEGDMEVPF